MNRILFAVAAVVTGLSGCVSPARYVEKSPTGDTGVIAIPANTDTWPMHYRSEAVALIQKHVGPNFEIVDEKEVVVGNRTDNNQYVKREQAYNNPFTGPVEKDTITNTTSTHDLTEYRITYRKKSGPMAIGLNNLTSTGGGGLTQTPTGPAGVTQTQYISGSGAAGVQPAGATSTQPASPATATQPTAGTGPQPASPASTPPVGATSAQPAGAAATGVGPLSAAGLSTSMTTCPSDNCPK
jgi:hypothetical protein